MRPLFVAFVCTCLALLARPLLSPLDGRVLDTGVVSRLARPDDSVAILGIDEKFMQGKHVYLTPRARLGQLINIVSQNKPKAIALDVWLDSRVDETGDAALRAALLAARKRGVPVVLADVETVVSKPESRRGTSAHGSVIPYFRTAARTASVTFADGVVREIPASHLPPMPLEMARLMSKKGSTVEFDRTLLPLPIDYRGPSGTLAITPAASFLEQPFLAALLEGKTVFIGATYPRSFDFLQTPYSFEQPKREFYGVEVLANASLSVRDALEGKAVRRSEDTASAWRVLAIVAFVLALLVAFAAWRHALLGVGALVLGIGGALVLGFLSSRNIYPSLGAHFWPPSVFVLVSILSCGASVAWRGTLQSRELRLVRETFGAYVGDEVLAALGGKLPELGGELRPIAVLFCDIRGYSALAERMQDDPAKLLQTLNEHFEPLIDALKKRGAYADNYVGDLVMALFGAPVSVGFATDVQSAVEAARDFVRLVEERNILRRAAGEEPIEVGIGLHCGEAVVGNLGSSRKIHYTAIGDVVNIASRVESATRKYDVPLLVTEEIVHAAGGDWQFVEETLVKGRAAPVRLYKSL